MLPEQTRQRIVAEAEKRGADPDKAIAEAERMHGETEKSGAKASDDSGSEFPTPFKSQLLIGHLPFVRVRELRNIWLGLTERIPDDDLTCGEFARKYGGAGPVAEPPAQEAA